MTRRLRPALVLFALVASACASPPLLERAIDSQGGSLERWSRRAEVRVYHAFPGVWNWEMAFRAPDHYRFTLLTAGPPQHYSYDGATLRAFIGATEISNDEGGDARAFASHARWMAVISLTPLQDMGGLVVEERPIDGGDPRGERSLLIEFADGARYRLHFDGDDRLVHARGPIQIPGIGEGDLEARFLDYREVGGFELPFATRYSLEGEPLFDERVIEFVPQDPALAEASFAEAPRRRE